MKHIDPKTLLAHHGWVRALARTLASDAAGADDLEQEVWSRALSNRTRRGSDLRAWLGSIVRNSAREGWRAESRAREAHQRIGRDVKPGQEFGSHRGAEETPLDLEDEL
ncbi:MAG: DNA-directed RNA polymerase specialized sigma24 family protein [Planctomycetota bacterium]|jgi:DNA-directed RNA polymerase specialized sigma24 family protein